MSDVTNQLSTIPLHPPDVLEGVVVDKPRVQGQFTKDDPRRGKPFSGKDDPRRNERGVNNLPKRKFGMSLRDMLIEEGCNPSGNIDGENKNRMQRVVERIFDEAELGEAWACQLLFERIDGKVPAVVNTDAVDVQVFVIRGASTDQL